MNNLPNKKISSVFLIGLFVMVLGFGTLLTHAAGAETMAGNRLALPTIGVDQSIIESATIAGIREKVWHRGVKNPEDGNFVLVAHNTLNLLGIAKGTFYDLPKVKVGDQAVVYWNGKTYTYKITKAQIVPPSAVQIEFNTPTPVLTAYSCIWTGNAKNRFMIRGDLISVE